MADEEFTETGGIITCLSNEAFVRKAQGQISKSRSFNKLGDRYIAHYDEEMGWVTKFIDRILDLGGEVKVKLGR